MKIKDEKEEYEHLRCKIWNSIKLVSRYEMSKKDRSDSGVEQKMAERPTNRSWSHPHKDSYCNEADEWFESWSMSIGAKWKLGEVVLLGHRPVEDGLVDMSRWVISQSNLKEWIWAKINLN